MDNGTFFSDILWVLHNIVISFIMIIVSLVAGWLLMWKLYLSKVKWIRVAFGLNGTPPQNQKKEKQKKLS